MNHIDSANYNSQNLEIGVLYVILQKYVYTCKSFEQSIMHNVFFNWNLVYICIIGIIKDLSNQLYDSCFLLLGSWDGRMADVFVCMCIIHVWHRNYVTMVDRLTCSFTL